MLASLAFAWPTWAVGLLTLLFVLISLVLILTVLIQKPQGGGLSGAFGSGSGSGQTAFGTKTGDALTVATIIIFTIYLVLGVVLVFAYRPQAAPIHRASDKDATPAGETAPAEGGKAGDKPADTTKTPAGAAPAKAPATTPATPGGTTPPANTPPATNPPAATSPQPVQTTPATTPETTPATPPETSPGAAPGATPPASSPK